MKAIMYKPPKSKSSLIYLIIQIVVCVVNIVITWVFGASKIATTLLWLLIFTMSLLVVLLEYRIDCIKHYEKQSNELIEFLAQENTRLAEENFMLRAGINKLNSIESDAEIDNKIIRNYGEQSHERND